MPPIPYQGAACITLAIDRDVTRGIYWLNMKDSAPYGAVVSHTNFIPVERYGEHLVYLASYFSGTVPAHIDKTMIDDFCTRFSIAPKRDPVAPGGRRPVGRAGLYYGIQITDPGI